MKFRFVVSGTGRSESHIEALQRSVHDLLTASTGDRVSVQLLPAGKTLLIVLDDPPSVSVSPEELERGAARFKAIGDEIFGVKSAPGPLKLLQLFRPGTPQHVVVCVGFGFVLGVLGSKLLIHWLS
jgi:hypothetical protein